MRYIAATVLIAGLFAVSPTGGETSGDIVAQWHFDEGTGKTIQDSSGNDNHGEFLGNPRWGKGVKGTALLLDGASAVQVVTGRPLGVDNAITIEAWIKPENRYGRIVMKNIYSGGDKLFLLGCTDTGYGLPDGGLKFNVRSMDNRSKGEALGCNLWDGRWHCVAVTCDGSLIKMYLDGKLDFAGVSVEPYEGGIDPGVAPLWLGGYGTKVGPLKGMIDEVTIWKRALTEDEIERSYEELKPFP